MNVPLPPAAPTVEGTNGTTRGGTAMETNTDKFEESIRQAFESGVTAGYIMLAAIVAIVAIAAWWARSR